MILLQYLPSDFPSYSQYKLKFFQGLIRPRHCGSVRFCDLIYVPNPPLLPADPLCSGIQAFLLFLKQAQASFWLNGLCLCNTFFCLEFYAPCIACFIILFGFLLISLQLQPSGISFPQSPSILVIVACFLYPLEEYRVVTYTICKLLIYINIYQDPELTKGIADLFLAIFSELEIVFVMQQIISSC